MHSKEISNECQLNKQIKKTTIGRAGKEKICLSLTQPLEHRK